ncbi:MAG: hypothetical protein ACF8R7_06865 [Phycisphaerales bacterium JB039]
MTRTLAIVILASALPAAAQDQGWIIRFDQALVTPADPVFWVECWAYFPTDDYAFAGALWNLHASEEGWGDLGGSMLKYTGPGEPPFISGSSVFRIVDGQLNFPPAGIYADPTNPIAVWHANFEVTDLTPRDITIRTETRQGAIYPLRESSASEQRPWTEGEGVIRVIPAPGALGLLGLGALAGAPRRRRP